MKTVAGFAAFFFCLAVVLFMTAADDTAQRKAEAYMAARLFTKFPDNAVASMAVPLHGEPGR